MKFAGLNINGWRQFDDINLTFGPKVTIITGSNGAGKSTLLRILGQHLGWNNNILGTPVMQSTGMIRYLSGLFKIKQKLDVGKSPLTNAPTDWEKIGSITYSTGNVANINIPGNGTAQYNIQLQNSSNVDGIYIQSHRPIPIYQRVANIPTNAMAADAAYQQYKNEILFLYDNRHSQFGPIYRMKEALISMATFGPGNKNVVGNPDAERIYNGFEDTLKRFLPPDLGFQHLSVRLPDVVMVTKSGDFVIDAASGGLMSLVDLAWQIYLYSQGKHEFVVILDEPENHLHPSMQRSIVDSMINAFPNAQFIIATHSPFVVSSFKEATVYVLRYNERVDADPTVDAPRTVSSVLLDQVSKAGSASEILRDALGVPITIPIWAENEINKISTEFSIKDLDSAAIVRLRARLDQSGLSEYYSDAIKQVASRND
jgi:ABC-type Mn2+/Zn2+ transport system ATPase subunit